MVYLVFNEYPWSNGQFCTILAIVPQGGSLPDVRVVHGKSVSEAIRETRLRPESPVAGVEAMIRWIRAK